MLDPKKLFRTAQAYLPLSRDRFDAAQAAMLRWLRRPHEADFAAIAVLPMRKRPLFLDVGANRGQSIQSMRLVRPDARIEAFEPNPRLAERLAAQFGPGVRVHALGLSDSAGTIDLHIPHYRGMSYDGLASLDRDYAAGWLNAESVYGFDARRLAIETVTCRSARLDDLGLDPDFIKLDVEGHELAVLRGATETLAASHPALLVENGHANREIIAFLGRLGYRPRFFEKHRFVEAPLRPKLNCFFLTDAALRSSSVAD